MALADDSWAKISRNSAQPLHKQNVSKMSLIEVVAVDFPTSSIVKASVWGGARLYRFPQVASPHPRTSMRPHIILATRIGSPCSVLYSCSSQCTVGKRAQWMKCPHLHSLKSLETFPSLDRTEVKGNSWSTDDCKIAS